MVRAGTTFKYIREELKPTVTGQTVGEVVWTECGPAVHETTYQENCATK